MSIVNFKIVVGGIVLILMLNACKMGPNYSRPPQVSPQSFLSDFNESASIANTEWWGFFGDTVLLRLINTSLMNNRDLRTSMARMEEASAQLGIVRANLFPRINYGVDGKGQVTTEGGGIDGSGAVGWLCYRRDRKQIIVWIRVVSKYRDINRCPFLGARKYDPR